MGGGQQEERSVDDSGLFGVGGRSVVLVGGAKDRNGFDSKV